MPVATLDPHADTLVRPTDLASAADVGVPVICLSDDDEIDTFRAAVADAR